MAALLARAGVISKLGAAVKGLDVSPGGSALTTIAWLRRWVGIAPTPQLASILDLDLFPRWTAVLRRARRVLHTSS
jgi:hypothetical protein